MKALLFIILLFACTLSSWRQGLFKLETTIEHQMIPEKDTIIATHWHKVDNKFYIILPDSTDVWVDNVRELK